MSDPREYCTFQVGSLRLGLGVELVQEVIRLRELTPVPLSAPAVRGLINLRGRIVTAIDLRRRFRIGGDDEADSPMHVVCHTAAGSVSFLADSVGDVIRAVDGAVEPVPATLDPEVGALLKGVVELDDGLLLLLDADRAAAVESDSADGERIEDPLAV